MVSINAQEWLTTKVVDLKNAKQICGTKDGEYSRDKKNREILTGDLVIENLDKLEELNLYDVRELSKVVIKKCPKLKKVNLLNSGVKQLEIGPELDRIEKLSIGFEIDSTDRPIARKLDKVNLSKVINLKELRCIGVQETELMGFEKLTQLEVFRGDDGVKIPIKEFNKWKEKLDIITNPNGLDLLKGGTGSDKDDVDHAKLDDYKNRPTKGQLDSAKDKVKEYEEGLKTDLGLDNDTLPNWRNEITKLKSKPTGTTLSSTDQYKINNFDRLKKHSDEQKQMITRLKHITEGVGELKEDLNNQILQLENFKI